MRENSYFQRFHGGWPIRDFIKQYLLNNSDNYKRAMRQERAAEAKDDENWEDEDDDMSVEEEVGDDTVDSEEEEDIVIGDDEDVDEEPDNVEEPAEYEELDEDALEDILDLEDDGEENGAKMVWSPAPSTPINAKKSKVRFLKTTTTFADLVRRKILHPNRLFRPTYVCSSTARPYLLLVASPTQALVQKEGH